YEGYMGNWGNTMDRWYRRGAVVFWPRRNDFAVRAAASPMWSLRTLTAHLRAGRLAQAQEFAATLDSFWGQVVTRILPGPSRSDAAVRAHRALFGRALEVASGLGDPDLALTLLRPFSAATVSSGHASVLARLGQHYGESWVGVLLAAWDERGARRMYDQDRLAWLASLPALCGALRDAGEHGTMVARLLLRNSWMWLAEAIATRCRAAPPSRRDQALDELVEPIAALLTGTAVAGAPGVRDETLAALGEASEVMLPCLVRIQRVTADADEATVAAAGLRDLAAYCVERLEHLLARPPRPPDDWSIALPPGCGCDLCERLGTFLADREQHSLDWPLAQHGRQHVHTRIDAHGLPVRHQTRRAGRPYTLVLTKTRALFEREAASRRQDQDDLAWLRSHLR
ncbi:MAG: 2OG-Fe(II) oxygenase, partial [Sciscionella sp.]